jgi:hypothetical protein
MKEINDLIKMFNRETLNKMSGDQKRAYKYCLCAISINIIVGGHYQNGQLGNFSLARDIKKMPRKESNFLDIVNKLSQTVNANLESKHFKKPYNDEFLNKIIQFIRKRLTELKKSQSLFQARELMDFLYIDRFFRPHPVSEHSWIDFTLYNGIIWTIPEMIIFSDFKVQWNEYIQIRETLKNKESEYHEFWYIHPELRANDYRLFAFRRVLVFLCVSFVEAYLYNLFYCIKYSNLPNKNQVKYILKCVKITDKEIVERLVFKLFPEVKNSLNGYFKKHLVTIDYRDRYVHASPFINEADKSSKMQPLLSLSESTLIDLLQSSVDFVLKLEELLPNELKLLSWWYDDDKINFKEFKLLKLTNPNK